VGSKDKTFVLFRRKDGGGEKVNKYEFTPIWCAEIVKENEDYDNPASYQLCCQGSGKFVPWQYFVIRHDCLKVKYAKGGFTLKKQGAKIHPMVRKHESLTGQSSWFIATEKFEELEKKKVNESWPWSKTWLDFRIEDSNLEIILDGATFQSNGMLSAKDLHKLRADSFCRRILLPQADAEPKADVQPRDEHDSNSEPEPRVHIDASDSEDEEGSEGGIVSDDESFGRYSLAECTAKEVQLYFHSVHGTHEPEEQNPLLCLLDG
jgi:hypothetical protein